MNFKKFQKKHIASNGVNYDLALLRCRKQSGGRLVFEIVDYGCNNSYFLYEWRG